MYYFSDGNSLREGKLSKVIVIYCMDLVRIKLMKLKKIEVGGNNQFW